MFKPVTKFMEDRAKRIKDSIDEAEIDKAHAKDLIAKYEGSLKTANAEADSIIRYAKELANIEAEKIISDSRIIAERELTNTRKQLEMEHRAAIANFRQEAAALVVATASKLLEREIDGEDSRQYAQILLNEVAGDPEKD
ncbi:MAG: ATP synthase F0 subunit B [Treponema sp.]|nr:ATP synthase F0 subunit B [Treponema sp.]